QLLIDRLVFVKVLSDREIEEDYLARMAEIVERDGLAENDCGWFVACQNLFGELNQMYNGSVFAPREELERVRVSNKVVRDIIGDLLPENSPYNFAVLPVEILGTIYERFLGRVVHATDARVKIEDKPEVRKAGGVYYTPQYIVNYIVQNTVGKLLADCKTPADVARLKILDPACGSGSFLLGAYDALLEWHKTYFATGDGRPTTDEKIRRPSSVVRRSSDAYYLDDDGRVRLTAKLKRQILLNNLFGVDIDPQAVEVTRLSLSLKALEETRAAEAHHERTLFNQTLLPDLTNNIKCGNSLIGTDYICVDDAELKRVKPFDWAAEFSEIFNREDAKDVKEKQGFDAVIGNPP
ncbi:MAG: DNA methyltransferase, partial [Chloroflexota bacterium]